MNKNICFECDSVDLIHQHHVVPRSLGGRRTIPLCEPCHIKVHGTNIGHSQLSKMGLKRKKAEGFKLGRPIGTGGKSKLDKYKDEIIGRKGMGHTNCSVLKWLDWKHGVTMTESNFSAYLKRHGIKSKK